MALLGYRVSQRSVLWPLALVLFPAWILLLWLRYEPEKDGHTRMAYRHHLEARLNLMYGDGKQQASARSLLSEAEEAGLLTDSLALDAALALEAVGMTDKAQTLLASADLTGVKPEELQVVRQTLAREPLTPEQTQLIQKRLAAYPTDWWTRRIATLGGMEVSPLGVLPQNAKWVSEAENRNLAWGMMLVVPALVCLYLSGWMLWRHSWPRFVWAERIQALWSVPQVLFALGLRGVLTLALRWIIGFLLLATLTRLYPSAEAAYQTHLSLIILLHSALAVALVLLVKEILAGRSSRLHEVLGFDQYDLLDWRLWVLALGIGVPLAAMLDSLTRRLDQLHLGGHALLDSLGASTIGYSGFVTALFLLQLVVLAPFVEEVIYRGFLLAALKNWSGPWIASLLSSAIFALAHTLSAAGLIAIFVQGLVLCFIRLRTRRLAAAMLVHAMMNLAGYLLSR